MLVMKDLSDYVYLLECEDAVTYMRTKLTWIVTRPQRFQLSPVKLYTRVNDSLFLDLANKNNLFARRPRFQRDAMSSAEKIFSETAAL